MHSRLPGTAAALAIAIFTVTSAWAPAASANDVDAVTNDASPIPVLSEKTKAVSGFAVGSLAGLLIGGRKKKSGAPKDR